MNNVPPAIAQALAPFAPRISDAELAELTEVSPVGSLVLWQESWEPHIVWDNRGRAWHVGNALGKRWKERRPEHDETSLAAFEPPDESDEAFVRRLISEPEMQRLIHKAAVDWLCDRIRELGYAAGPKPSLVVPCPACDGGWRDVNGATIMCGQCHGSGRVATNGGEP